MRVDEIGVARGASRGRREGGRESGKREEAGGMRLEIPDDPGTVGDPEVAECGRRHDFYVHFRAAHVVDAIGDEPSRRIPREPGI